MKGDTSGLLKGRYITKVVQLYHRASKYVKTETHRNEKIVKTAIKIGNSDILLLVVDRTRL